MTVRPAFVVKAQLADLLQCKKLLDGMDLSDVMVKLENENICREEAELRNELALAQMNESHSHAK